MTSVICKTREHTVVSATPDHTEKYRILCDYQHGFKKKKKKKAMRDTTLGVCEDLAENLENCEQTGIFIMDFAKAFDKVSHSLWRHKVRQYVAIKAELNC